MKSTSDHSSRRGNGVVELVAGQQRRRLRGTRLRRRPSASSAAVQASHSSRWRCKSSSRSGGRSPAKADSSNSGAEQELSSCYSAPIPRRRPAAGPARGIWPLRTAPTDMPSFAAASAGDVPHDGGFPKGLPGRCRWTSPRTRWPADEKGTANSRSNSTESGRRPRATGPADCRSPNRRPARPAAGGCFSQLMTRLRATRRSQPRKDARA